MISKLNLPSISFDGRLIKETAQKYMFEHNKILPKFELHDVPQISESVKEVGQKILSVHSSVREKIKEHVKNNVVILFFELIENTIKNVSCENLKNAVSIIDRDINKYNCKIEYISMIKEVIKSKEN